MAPFGAILALFPVFAPALQVVLSLRPGREVGCGRQGDDGEGCVAGGSQERLGFPWRRSPILHRDLGLLDHGGLILPGLEQRPLLHTARPALGFVLDKKM